MTPDIKFEGRRLPFLFTLLLLFPILSIINIYFLSAIFQDERPGQELGAWQAVGGG